MLEGQQSRLTMTELIHKCFSKKLCAALVQEFIRGISFAQVFLLGLLSALTLSGCGTTFVYVQPSGPDIATITLTNYSHAPLRAMESHKGDCTDMWWFGGN